MRVGFEEARYEVCVLIDNKPAQVRMTFRSGSVFHLVDMSESACREVAGKLLGAADMIAARLLEVERLATEHEGTVEERVEN